MNKGKFSQLFVTFSLLGLMIISILATIITLEEDNNPGLGFADDSLISKTYTDLSENLGGFRNQSQSQKTLFETENPTSGFGTILLFSIVNAGKVFNSMIIGIWNILIVLPASYWGVSQLVIGVIGALLIAAIIFGLWAVYKLGG